MHHGPIDVSGTVGSHLHSEPLAEPRSAPLSPARCSFVAELDPMAISGQLRPRPVMCSADSSAGCRYGRGPGRGSRDDAPGAAVATSASARCGEVTTVGRPGTGPVALDVLLTLSQAVRDRATVSFDHRSRVTGSPDVSSQSPRSTRAAVVPVRVGSRPRRLTAPRRRAAPLARATRRPPPCRGSCPVVMSTPSVTGLSENRWPTSGRAVERSSCTSPRIACGPSRAIELSRR